MEIVRTSPPNGYVFNMTSGGTAERYVVSGLANRYVRIVCPDEDLWFYVTTVDPTASPTINKADTAHTALTAVNIAEPCPGGLTGVHLQLPNATNVWLVAESATTDTKILVKPTSDPLD